MENGKWKMETGKLILPLNCRLNNPDIIARLQQEFPDMDENPDAEAVFLKLRELRNLW